MYRVHSDDYVFKRQTISSIIYHCGRVSIYFINTIMQKSTRRLLHYCADDVYRNASTIMQNWAYCLPFTSAPHGCVFHALRCDPSRCVHAYTWTHRDGTYRNGWKTHPCGAGLNPAVAGVFRHLRLAGGGGGGVKRPHVITRERMAAERRATRRSKALDETILKHPLNFPNKVTCQVKVRSKFKIGAFRLRAVKTSKLSILGQNLLRILLKYRARHWLSKCLILSSVQVKIR